MKQCDKCGAQLPDGAMVCPSCGAYSRPVRRPVKPTGGGLPLHTAAPVPQPVSPVPPAPSASPPAPDPPKPSAPDAAPKPVRSTADRLLAGTMAAVVCCCLLLVAGSGVYLYAAGEQGRLDQLVAAEQDQIAALRNQRDGLEQEAEEYQWQLAALREELASLTESTRALQAEAAPFDASSRDYDLPQELAQRQQELTAERERLLSQIYGTISACAGYYTLEDAQEELPSPFNGLFAGRAEARSAFRTLMAFPAVREDILSNEQYAQQINALPSAAVVTATQAITERCARLSAVEGPEQLGEDAIEGYVTDFLELCQAYGYLNRLCEGAAGLSLTDESEPYRQVLSLWESTCENQQLLALYQQIEP